MKSIFFALVLVLTAPLAARADMFRVVFNQPSVQDGGHSIESGNGSIFYHNLTTGEMALAESVSITGADCAELAQYSDASGNGYFTLVGDSAGSPSAPSLLYPYASVTRYNLTLSYCSRE